MNRNTCKVLVLLICAIAPMSVMAEAPISVPYGTAVSVDGTMNAEEWADASRVELPRSAELWLKHDHDSLYVGIRASELGMFVGNLCVIRDSFLDIYHSSAALGTATYRWEPTPSSWILARQFSWRCRRLGFSPAAVQERERFFADEGWVASISYLGRPDEMEYQLTVPCEPMCVWLALLPSSGGELLYWPEIADQDIFPGPIPEQAHIGLDSWARLILEPAPAVARTASE